MLSMSVADWASPRRIDEPMTPPMQYELPRRESPRRDAADCRELAAAPAGSPPSLRRLDVLPALHRSCLCRLTSPPGHSCSLAKALISFIDKYEFYFLIMLASWRFDVYATLRARY